MRRIVRLGAHINDRSLRAYGEALGPEFIAKLNSLGPEDTWVDLGAGSDLALVQYLTLESVPGFELPPVNQRAQVVSIGVDTPDPILLPDVRRDFQKVLKRRGKSVYRQLQRGKFFSQIPLRVIRSLEASLMTSVQGILSYTENLPESLARALAGMRDGGSLFHSSATENMLFSRELVLWGAESQINDPQLEAFLEDISGANVHFIKTNRNHLQFSLDRNRDDISIAPLNVKFTHSEPPFRTFKRAGRRNPRVTP